MRCVKPPSIASLQPVAVIPPFSLDSAALGYGDVEWIVHDPLSVIRMYV